jgi:hypothetical protein
MNYRESGVELEQPIKQCRRCEHAAHRRGGCPDCPVDGDCNRIPPWRIAIFLGMVALRETPADGVLYWLAAVAVVAAIAFALVFIGGQIAQWWSRSDPAMRALHEAQLEPSAPTPIRVDAADQRVAVDEREAGNEAVRDRAAAEG